MNNRLNGVDNTNKKLLSKFADLPIEESEVPSDPKDNSANSGE